VILHKIASLKVEGDVHQSNERRDLDQGPDHRGKGRAGIDSEDRHRDRDG
jgi:hypothetical protein